MKQSFQRLGTLACFAFIAIAISCDTMCIRGEGGITTEDRNMGTFHSIKLNIPAQVKLTQGAVIQTRIEAQPNLLKLIKTSVAKEKLEITSDECFGENKGITVFITMPQINLLSIDGSGNIETTSPINVSKLELVIHGSGDIKLNATSELVYCGIKGSGNVILAGSSKQQYVKIDGSGNYKASDFATENSEINIQGSGNAEVFAISRLKAEISGSGSVFYKGNPDVKSKINGSGNISRL
ncbi:MAG: head GIN domain-containing protein [Bacteroidales bacterium]